MKSTIFTNFVGGGMFSNQSRMKKNPY